MSNTNCCCHGSPPPPNPNTLCCNCYDPCKTPQKLTPVLTGGNAINGNCSCPDITIPLQIIGPCYWSGTAKENVCSGIISTRLLLSCGQIGLTGEMEVNISLGIGVDSIFTTLTTVLYMKCLANGFVYVAESLIYTGSSNFTPMMDCSSIDLSIPLTVQGYPLFCCYFTLTVNN